MKQHTQRFCLKKFAVASGGSKPYTVNAQFMRIGAGIMEANDRQVTTVFTAQPSFHHRHSTNQVS